jgi:hypothetical protein
MAFTGLVCVLLPGCGPSLAKKFKVTVLKGGQPYPVEKGKDYAMLQLISTENPEKVYTVNPINPDTAVFEVVQADGKKGIPKGEYKIAIYIGLYGGGQGPPPGAGGGAGERGAGGAPPMGPPGGAPPMGPGGAAAGGGGHGWSGIAGGGKDKLGDKFAPDNTKIIRKIDGNDLSIDVDRPEG